MAQQAEVRNLALTLRELLSGGDWPKYLARKLTHDGNPLAHELGRELGLVTG